MDEETREKAMVAALQAAAEAWIRTYTGMLGVEGVTDNEILIAGEMFNKAQKGVVKELRERRYMEMCIEEGEQLYPISKGE